MIWLLFQLDSVSSLAQIHSPREGSEFSVLILIDQATIACGVHKFPSSVARRPHPPQTNFISESLSLQTCLASTSGVPQKLHSDLSSQGLHRCPESSESAPQVLHV